MSYSFKLKNALTNTSLQILQKSFIKMPKNAHTIGDPIVFGNGVKMQIPKEYRHLLKPIFELANNYMVEFSFTKESSQQWKLDFEDLTVTVPQEIRFTLDSLDSTIFSETFVFDIHFTEFDLRDKIVIDAGGFVGDTALYYANRGASVYTFEPDPLNYSKLVRNIKLNDRLAHLVHPFNMALGFDGYVDFPVGEGGNGSFLKESPKMIRVPSISIDTILKEQGILDPYLLHLDVKGAEHNILQTQPLNKFKRLRIEYSPYLDFKTKAISDYPEWMQCVLKEQGFNEIRIFKHNNNRKSLGLHGTIEAAKAYTI